MKSRLIISLFAVLVLTGCNSASTSTPEDTTQPETEQQQVQEASESKLGVEQEVAIQKESPTPETVQEPVVKEEAPAAETNNEAAVTTYTIADVEAHSTKESCYTTIDGKVYDITSYIPHHPGGERDIMKICGRDGSSMFGRQHGGDYETETKLASLYIGELTQ